MGSRASPWVAAALVLIVVGAFGVLGGLALARDWLLVNQEVVGPGLDVRARVLNFVREALRRHDALEWVVAAGAAWLLALGLGILIGRWSASR